MIGLDSENLRRCLQVVPGKQRRCAGVGTDTDIFKRARKGQELRLAGKTDTQGVQLMAGSATAIAPSAVRRNFTCSISSLRISAAMSAIR